MAKPFKGTIDIDVRDSVPDWEPFREPVAPPDAPNILYIVWDDVGFGAFDIYGGTIETPNMKRIADMGLRYTQFHTTALCSPTRSCLLSGRNATSNGFAGISEIATGFPGSNGRIPFENALISEVLVERGYNTYCLGKWHLNPSEEGNLAASKRHWPLGRGFERFYGFLGGETSQWYPDLVYDNHPQEPQRRPEQGYHLSADLADEAIQFISDAKAIAPEKPWLMYFAPGASHAPHQVWKEWSDRYKGAFDDGYETYCEQTLARQKRMGLVPEAVELNSLNPYVDRKSADGKPWPELDIVRPWASLSADEKRLFARMAEVFAGFTSYTDAQIGRILDFLEKTGQLENTVVVVVSDNGASGEGGPNGSVNENKMFNGVADTIEENLKLLDDLGSPKTYNHYCTGWTRAFNAPFKMWKRYSQFEGGTADPLIIAWPKGIAARGELRHQYVHAIDIVPTLYECLGIDPPDVVKGYAQSPLEGRTFRATFDDAGARTDKVTQFYAMLGTRGIWHKGWHASTVHAPAPSDWGHFEADEWELYDLEHDRNQRFNLAAREPEKLEKLKSLWFYEAGEYKGLPLDDRDAVTLLNTPRPSLTKPRERYVYYPGTAEIPEAVAPNIRHRSYNIVAEVRIDTPEAEGVLFSQGGRFGGHSLYIKDGSLRYVYNWLGEKEQRLASKSIPIGPSRLGVRFRLEGHQGPVPTGTAALYINDEMVDEGKFVMQPGNFSLVGEGLNIGRDTGTPVSSEYLSPFDFHGGVIGSVTVDISGERYRDLEKELALAFAQE